jgi:cytoskeleton protein RodZ
MVDTSSTNKNEDMLETPGQLLRLHREKMGLSAQDIAKRIHLDIKIVEAIESDSSEGMPSAIYVRGYLRSYAKTVDADADRVIELYNSDTPPAPPEILPEVKPPSQVSSNDKPVKAFTYLITLGLVLLLLIWYQSNFVVDTRTNIVEQTNTKTRINGVDVTYDIIFHDDSWQSPDVLIEEPESLTTSEARDENELLKLQIFNEEQTIEISTTENTEPDEDKVSIGSGTDIIELELTSDSWIEIVDNDNNKLFHDLATSGEKYTLKGTAPFEVLFGFAKGVNLTFNGNPVNFESHSKKGIARFTLPE